MTCSIRKGVLFRRYRVYAGLDQPVGKEAVLFVDLLRHFPAHIGQMQKIVAVHCQEAPFPQGRHRMAHAGLCDLQVPGDIHGAHHTHLLMENKDGLQIVLPGRMKFHKDLPSLLSQAPSSSTLSDIDEILIDTRLLQKFLVGAMLCDLAVVNYQDLIGILDGIQTVSNHKQGLTLYQF